MLWPLVVVPLAFLIAAPWLESIDEKAFGLAAAATALFVMGYGTYLTTRWQRKLDEVQKAGAGFSAQWGVHAGTVAFALLLSLPPFRDFATALVGDWTRDADGEAKVVAAAMTFAFCGVVLLQSIGIVVTSAMWWMAKR